MAEDDSTDLSNINFFDTDVVEIGDYLRSLGSDITGTGSLNDIIKGLGNVLAGTSSLGKTGQYAGLLGIAGLANKLFGSSGGGGFAGYQGKIPTYTASRTMNTIPTTVPNPLAGQTGQPATIPRRPGSGGITYFSPMVYTPVVTGGGGNDTVAGGAGNDTVQGASGGIMSLRSYADGGNVADSGNVLTNPYQQYINSLKEEEFLQANKPAGEEVVVDIYGNMVMPDPYLRNISYADIDQMESNAAKEYYKNPENAAAASQNYQTLYDAVMVPSGEGIDVQETLRNINKIDPEMTQEFLKNITEAPQKATDYIYETVIGRGSDGLNYEDRLAAELGAIPKDFAADLQRTMTEALDPNAPRTFYKSYEGYPLTEESAKSSGRGGLHQENTKFSDEDIDTSYLPPLNPMSSRFRPEFTLEKASGGIASLGSYSDGGQLLRGPGDGVSDDIPATIADRQPARLADGEFVIPARIVSELGNGSTEAGARKLYAMMDRIKNARRKAKDIAADTKTDRYLPR